MNMYLQAVSVAFAHNAPRLAANNSEGSVFVWDANTGKEIVRYVTDDLGAQGNHLPPLSRWPPRPGTQPQTRTSHPASPVRGGSPFAAICIATTVTLPTISA
jgi:hypothetical protein